MSNELCNERQHFVLKKTTTNPAPKVKRRTKRILKKKTGRRMK